MSDISALPRKSLRFRIGVSILLMVLLLETSGGASLWYFSELGRSVQTLSDEALPSLEMLNTTQLSIAQIANVSREIANSSSSAETRILLAQVHEQILELKGNLNRLIDYNEQVKGLNDIVALVEPGVAGIAASKALLDQTEKALQIQVSKAMDVAINLSQSTRSLEVQGYLNSLALSLSRFLFNEHLFEQQKTIRDVQQTLQILKLQAPEAYQLVSATIIAPQTVLDLLEQRETHYSEVVGLDTQNRILLGSVVDFGHRVYEDMKNDVVAQSKATAKNAMSFMEILAVVLLAQLVIAFLLVLYLHKHLFKRLHELNRLVAQHRPITDTAIAFFDQHNELGILVRQLRTYVDTISTQQQQIEETSQQLQTIIKLSQMRVTVFANASGDFLFCSDPLRQLFAQYSLTQLSDFPRDVQACVDRLLAEQITSDKDAWVCDEASQRWYEITCNEIVWEHQQATLLCFVDVTDQVNAEREYKHTLSVVENEASIDPLTGLFNRKMFDKQIAEYQSHPKEGGFAVLLFDVDLFKQYNDHFGHLEGDHMLAMVATVIKANTPETGAAIRYGGEEFLLFLPDTSLMQALDIGQCIVEGVYAQKAPHPLSPHTYLSVSCGISLTLESSVPVLEVFDQADKSLYKAKSRGRNCIKVWDSKR